MSEFHFLRPLWLLALLPTMLVWWLAWRKSASLGSLTKVVDPHLLKHLLIDGDAVRGFRPVHLLACLWGTILLALSGPSWKQQPSPFADEQAGLFVLLRVSPTMLASDLQPTRLERARHKLTDLLELRAGSATGLIAYNGSAHLVMPLTRDGRIIAAMAESLSPKIMPRQGDALSEAITLAEAHFERAQMPGSVLIITDEITDSRATETDLPVQILALHSPGSPTPAGILNYAKPLNAGVTSLAFDLSDIEQINRLARSDYRFSATLSDKQRWQDGGYALLPLIGLLSLAFFRKGWQP